MSVPKGSLLILMDGQRLGDLLAEAFDRLPVDPDDSNFARPNQGEFERDSDLFDTQSLQQQGRCGSKIG